MNQVGIPSPFVDHEKENKFCSAFDTDAI